MSKAKFVRKYYQRNFSDHFLYMDYEYRGRIYTVWENLRKGNEPLSWQHAMAQAEIDREIEEEAKPKKPFKYEDTAQAGFDMLWEYFEKGECNEG